MLLQGAPVAWLSSVIPCRPRYAEAMLNDSQLSRLSIPGWLLTMMTGSPGASLLRWQVPAVAERLEVGDGRMTDQGALG